MNTLAEALRELAEAQSKFKKDKNRVMWMLIGLVAFIIIGHSVLTYIGL